MEKRGLTELAAVLAGLITVAVVAIVAMLRNSPDTHFLIMTLDGVAVAYFIRCIKGAVDRDPPRPPKSEEKEK